MPNPINTQALRADKRFEALLKQEMNEHQHIISSHHKEMQELRDALKISQERCESLAKKNEQDLIDFKKEISDLVFETRKKLNDKDLIIKDHRNGLDSLHNQMQDLHNFFASKSDLDKFANAIEDKINESNMGHLSSLQNMQNYIKGLHRNLKDETDEDLLELQGKCQELQDKFTMTLSTSKLDKDGVLKQIRIYERSMFIIEKKIENIYTLIERINNRSASCHKPAN